MSDSSLQLEHARRQLFSSVPSLLRKDALFLKKQFRKIREAKGDSNILADKFFVSFNQALQRFAARQAQKPVPILNDSLPVAGLSDHIQKQIEENQVVIIAGETGSGKTTQLPLIALQAGRGKTGLIGHTQPRRIAASSVAQRIAEELKEPLGKSVSFKVRFLEKGNDNAFIKLMTDGILLSELRRDPYLNQYDTLIIDEAHERSLNIDFLLGYLSLILPKRPDLKVIITSATIDVERFSQFFSNAPIINVEGRTYPVELRYRPLLDHAILDSGDDDIDQFEDKLPRAVVAAVEECLEDARNKGVEQQADILIFASTEQEIRDLQKVLEKYGPRHTQVLPLFARQSVQEQQRIFEPKGTGRRIIIATNVAETSLTVPNIRYVIDTGFARLSRYSVKSRIQRLPIEAVSQASANQRKGRCGRVAPGVCIRLYSEEDFNQRPEFTDPEIRRTNLASVILQMANLNLGYFEDFPFIDRPEGRYVSDAVKRLIELGALEEIISTAAEDGATGIVKHRITDIGRKMAALPVDPMLARMLLAASQMGSLKELLIIVSALAIQDIRERPFDKKAQADQKHALFRGENSDFLFYLNVWQALNPPEGKLSDKERKSFAKNHFFSWLRLREWKRLHEQLTEYVKQLNLSVNEEAADYSQIHQALLTGLLSHIGHRQEPDHSYLLPRQHHARLFPGSVLSKTRADWLMAFEMVETSQNFLRLAAKIDPEWVIKSAAPLLKFHYYEPHWSKKTGTVNAYAQISLWGLILQPKQRVRYDVVNTPESRTVFIQSALVEGKLGIDLPFLKHNLQLISELEEAEHLLRRKDLLPLESELFDFYQERLPLHIASRKSFLDWFNSNKQLNEQLKFHQEVFADHADAALEAVRNIQKTERFGQLSLPVEFYFDPSTEHDGVLVDLPAIAISQVSQNDFDWSIQLWREELLIALLQTLPKNERKQLLPIQQTARDLLDKIDQQDIRPLPTQIAQAIFQLKGIRIDASHIRTTETPAYLRPIIRIKNEQGKILAQGRELDELLMSADVIKATKFATTSPTTHKKAMVLNQLTTFPESFEFESVKTVNNVEVRQFNYLQLDLASQKAAVETSSASILTTHDRQLALEAQRKSVIALVLNEIKVLAKGLGRQFNQRLLIAFQAYGDQRTFVKSAQLAVIDTILYKNGLVVPLDIKSFKELVELSKKEFGTTSQLLLQTLEEILALLSEVKSRLQALKGDAFNRARDDMLDQLDALMLDRMLTDIPYSVWKEYPRYLQGMLKRIERLSNNLDKDDDGLDLVDPYMAALLKKPETYVLHAGRWALEELRIQLFAQPMKTSISISPKKLTQMWPLT